MQAWHEWMEKYNEQIVVAGEPLGKTKEMSKEGIRELKNNLCGYVIVTAENHDTAVSMFKEHPHFSIFPGKAVEVMECLKIPGME